MPKSDRSDRSYISDRSDQSDRSDRSHRSHRSCPRCGGLRGPIPLYILNGPLPHIYIHTYIYIYIYILESSARIARASGPGRWCALPRALVKPRALRGLGPAGALGPSEALPWALPWALGPPLGRPLGPLGAQRGSGPGWAPTNI